mmetsp:Transcript_32240/g.80289  ORF Transcript_32240/g.80289 Transcript_32240/m.80289 type:complete len:127 (-) Transcript_32240:188-568(-)
MKNELEKMPAPSGGVHNDGCGKSICDSAGICGIAGSVSEPRNDTALDDSFSAAEVSCSAADSGSGALSTDTPEGSDTLPTDAPTPETAPIGAREAARRLSQEAEEAEAEEGWAHAQAANWEVWEGN